MIINTNRNENKGISALLSITESGDKLPPYLIFQGSSGKTIEKKLNELDKIKNKKIFTICHNKAW